MLFFTSHPVFQDDRGADLIDKPLILAPRLFLHASVDDCPMGQHRGEAFVIILDGDRRTSIAPSPHEILHACQILRGPPVRLYGMTNNDPLDFLTLYILLEEVEQILRLHRPQSTAYDLQRIGDGQAGTSFAIINGENPCHYLLLIQQPGVALRVILAGTDGVTALHCRCLIVKGRGDDTIHIHL